MFDEERQFPRHTMWREARAEGKTIVVDCVPDEVEKYHLNDIKRDVARCNERYREHLKEEAQKRKASSRADAAEREKLEQMKGRLNFG
jgi:hypothetical protein